MFDLHVNNLVGQIENRPFRVAKVSDRKTLVIHRCGLGEDAAEIAKNFARIPEARDATGGVMPYTFVIQKNGVVDQALGFAEVGPHARMWNEKAIGIALAGDFRVEAPTDMQLISTISLLCGLSSWLGATNIFGHDELPSGTWDAAKECPGSMLNMSELRHAVVMEKHLMATGRLAKWGIEI